MAPTYLVLRVLESGVIASMLYTGTDEAKARETYDYEHGRARFARCKGTVYLTTVRAEAKLS